MNLLNPAMLSLVLVCLISQYRSNVVEESKDFDSIQAFVGVPEFCVIHRFDGSGHLFYTDAFAVFLVMPVPVIFFFFGTHVFTVSCTPDSFQIQMIFSFPFLRAND